MYEFNILIIIDFNYQTFVVVVMEEENSTSLQQLKQRIEELQEDYKVYQHLLSDFITNRFLYLFIVLYSR